jgi:transposase
MQVTDHGDEDEQCIDGLRSMSDGGRPSQLEAFSFKWLDTALRHGAQAHGFGTEVWTLKRVSSGIKRQFGVEDSDVHVSCILGSMGFSGEKPQRRVIERDEEAVRTWKRRTGLALKQSCPRQKSHPLHRRIGTEGASHAGTHLGAQGANAYHPASLLLEDVLVITRAKAQFVPARMSMGAVRSAGRIEVDQRYT